MSGLLIWTGGTMDGTGETNANGGLELSGTGTKHLKRVLNNAGTATWTAGRVRSYHGTGAVFNNLAGATLDAKHTGDLWFDRSGTTALSEPQFNNAGLLEKTTGSGSSGFDLNFNNLSTGSVDAQIGTINLVRGGTSGGSFVAQGGATLLFSGGTHSLDAASSITGGGTVQVSGGTVNMAGTHNVTGTTRLSGGTFNLNAAGTTTLLNISGGTLAGTGDLTVSGLLTWTSGTMDGTGETNANGGMALGNTTKHLKRVLNNAGTATWTAGRVRSYHGTGAVFNNLAGATLDMQHTGTQWFDRGGTTALAEPQFNNAGLIKKTLASGTSGFDLNFNNQSTGTVDAQIGIVSLERGGTSVGIFNTAASAIIQFNGGTHTIGGGTSFTGTGITQITSGIVNMGGTVTAANFKLTGGTLTGTGNLSVSGLLIWTGGTMSGSGKTTVEAAAALNISGTSHKNLNVRMLDNLGTATWTGTGNIRASDGSVFNNIGTFDAQNDRIFDQFSGALAEFNNSGTFKKTVGTGVTTIDVVFNNTGTLDAQSGTINLTRGGGVSTGVYNAAAGAAIQFGGETHTLNAGATIIGDGSTNVSSGTLVIDAGASGGSAIAATNFGVTGGILSGAGDIKVSGTMTWTGGTMSGSGKTTVEAAAALNISGTSHKNLNVRMLDNLGTATWTGTGNIRASDGSVFNNIGTFDAQNDRIFDQFSGALAEFNNSGTFKKTVGTGVTTIDVVFNNTGTLDAQSGTINLTRGGGTSTGNFNAGATEAIQFTIGTHTLGVGATITGSGATKVAGGTLVIDPAATIAAANFGITSGTLSGAGDLNVSGTLTWTGGTMNAAGTTRILGGGAMNISGSSSKTLRERTISNAGTVTWTGGQIHTGDAASFFNTGTWDVQTDADLLHTLGGTKPVFDNGGGTFQKITGATGDTNVTVFFDNTGGTITITSGTVSFNGGTAGGGFPP